ncbi:MAG: hypothetical protein JSW67_13190 [Candidatus Latescibacterota bacterium]|nr:MAG: hypothetical protein JSW67_13190 [Candidatus Latescibacterota bacterium]
MMNFEIAWSARAQPLVPAGLVAFDSAARQLVRDLSSREGEWLAPLRIAAGPTAVVVLGEAARLPWADGVTYVGRHPDASTLYLPTHSEPRVPIDLLARAIGRRVSSCNVIVCRNPPMLLPIEASQVLTRELLKHWLEKH